MPGRRRRLRRLLGTSVLAGGLFVSLLPVFAQDNTAATPVSVNSGSNTENQSWWQAITTDGFVSLSYEYNANQPSSRLNQFRVFDFNHNEPQLDVAQLVIQRAPVKPTQFGFRVNAIAGSGVPEITAAYGLFRNMKTGIAHHFDIPELYACYVVPVGSGLRLDAGKMVSHLGTEVIGGYDGYNDEFSRGFIFGFAVPFTYTGVKATYVFNRKLTGMVVLANGWDEFQRYNHGYSWGSQVTVTPNKATTLYFNFIHGPERPRNTRDQRSVGEIIGSWKTTPRLTFGFDAVYGHEEDAVAPGHDAIWRGLAFYSKYAFTQNFSVAFRGEFFNDSGGTRTGVDQTLQGYTFTPEYVVAAKPSDVAAWLKKLDGKFVVRGEFRLDRSNQNVFRTSSSTLLPHQSTTAVNLIYLF